MTRQEKLDAALQHVTKPTDDVVKVWREQINADQIDFVNCRRWMQTLREIPEGLGAQMLECVTMNDKKAFHHLFPDYIPASEFREAAAQKLERLAEKQAVDRKKTKTEKEQESAE